MKAEKGQERRALRRNQMGKRSPEEPAGRAVPPRGAPVTSETHSKALLKAASRGGLSAPPPAVLLISVVSTISLATVGAAWILRTAHYISPDRSLGYALGISGLTAMFLLLLYPLRKHGWAFREVGPIRIWFHVHMALGIIGPTLVLLHSNFQLGSMNSSIALASALIVGGSGYVGRFSYSRIHYGLSGRRAHFSDVRDELRRLRESLGTGSPQLRAAFDDFETWAGSADTGLAASLRCFARSPSRVNELREQVPWERLNQAAPEFLPLLEHYFRAAQRLARFRAYERLFGLWHALHIPLCFFLYGAALVHVAAVHIY